MTQLSSNTSPSLFPFLPPNITVLSSLHSSATTAPSSHLVISWSNLGEGPVTTLFLVSVLSQVSNYHQDHSNLPSASEMLTRFSDVPDQLLDNTRRGSLQCLWPGNKDTDKDCFKGVLRHSRTTLLEVPASSLNLANLVVASIISCFCLGPNRWGTDN